MKIIRAIGEQIKQAAHNAMIHALERLPELLTDQTQHQPFSETSQKDSPEENHPEAE